MGTTLRLLSDPSTARLDGARRPASLDTLNVVCWRDPLVEVLGYDPRSKYVEQFWLSVIGPTSTWLMRRLAARLEVEPCGFRLDLPETSRALGLSARTGTNSPLRRAIRRCTRFGLARLHAEGLMAVRRRMPPLSSRHVELLPKSLRDQHDHWSHRTDATTFDEARRVARRLALDLVGVEEDPDLVEAPGALGCPPIGRLRRDQVGALAGRRRRRTLLGPLTGRSQLRNAPFTSCS